MKQDNYTVVYNGITSNTVSIKQTEVSATTYDLKLSYTSDVSSSTTSSSIACSGITILNFDDGTSSSSVTSSFTKTVTYSENTDSSPKTNTGTITWNGVSKTWSITQAAGVKVCITSATVVSKELTGQTYIYYGWYNDTESSGDKSVYLSPSVRSFTIDSGGKAKGYWWYLGCYGTASLTNVKYSDGTTKDSAYISVRSWHGQDGCSKEPGYRCSDGANITCYEDDDCSFGINFGYFSISYS